MFPLCLKRCPIPTVLATCGWGGVSRMKPQQVPGNGYIYLNCPVAHVHSEVPCPLCKTCSSDLRPVEDFFFVCVCFKAYPSWQARIQFQIQKKNPSNFWIIIKNLLHSDVPSTLQRGLGPSPIQISRTDAATMQPCGNVTNVPLS